MLLIRLHITTTLLGLFALIFRAPDKRNIKKTVYLRFLYPPKSIMCINSQDGENSIALPILKQPGVSIEQLPDMIWVEKRRSLYIETCLLSAVL